MDDNTEQQVREGFVPIIRADGDVSLRESGALILMAGGDASLTEAGCGLFIAGGNVTMREAGAGNMIIGGRAEVGDGAIGSMLTAEAAVRDSRVAVLLAGRASLENSTVIIGTQQAIAIGVAAGLTMCLLRLLLRRAR